MGERIGNLNNLFFWSELYRQARRVVNRLSGWWKSQCCFGWLGRRSGRWRAKCSRSRRTLELRASGAGRLAAQTSGSSLVFWCVQM